MLLRVENLSVAIVRENANLAAVKGIGFNLEAGEILGIVGESGCGKSLTALSIPGLLPRAARVGSGSIVFEGRDLLTLPEEELRRIRGNEIAMVFQEPFLSLNPLLRVGEQIEESLLLHGKKDRRQNQKQVFDIMTELDLPDPPRLARAYPHQLSGGMCQRVMIASAMIADPKLLIADEPTTALDVNRQTQILELMKKINRERSTAILFISHDLGIIRKLCHRVLVMYAGKIVEWGSVDAVFERPLHEYTKGLILSIPSRERKGKALANIPGKVPSIEEELPGCPFANRCEKAQERCYALFPDVAAFDGGARSSDHCVHCFSAEAQGCGHE